MAKPKKRQESAVETSLIWLVVVAKAFPKLGVPLSLSQLYARLEGHPRTETRPYWKDEVRQALQQHPCFERIEKDVWVFTPGRLNDASESKR